MGREKAVSRGPMASRMRDNEGVAVEDVPVCPLCGGAGEELYRGLRDRLGDAPGVWSFRRCPACRHIWLDPRPLPAEVAKLYREYYTHSALEPRPPTPVGLAARRAVLAGLGYGVGGPRDLRIRSLLRFFPVLRESIERELRFLRGPPRGTLLDAGCGDGSFLAEMRGLGWKVLGLEPDPIAAEIARRRGIEVIQSPLVEGALPEDAFDAVVLNHVIEHVSDPVRTFDLCRRILKRSGVLVAVTPNAESRGHRRFGDAWFHLDPPRHLHLFTGKTLRDSAERAGLRVVELRTSAASADEARRASRAIRATGRFRPPEAPARTSLGDRAFRLAEWATIRVAPSAGEELLLFGTQE